MTIDEAKQVLIGYRPGSGDSEDPRVAEALALARREPALQAWLDQQAQAHAKLRRAFREIPVPSDLPETILRGRTVVEHPAAHSRWGMFLAMAAAFAGVLALLLFSIRPGAEEPFDVFRSRMVRSVLREYRMDIQTNSMTQIREFLAKNQAPADYELSENLKKAEPMGAGLLSWQDKRVSMVCLDAGRQGTLFLFVVDRAAVRGAPAEAGEFARVNKLSTASWSRGERSYMLASHLEPDQLAAFLSQ